MTTVSNQVPQSLAWRFMPEGSPTTAYEVRSDGDRIEIVNNPSAITSELIIRRVEPGDVGDYTCVAFNENRQAAPFERRVQLLVEGMSSPLINLKKKNSHKRKISN